MNRTTSVLIAFGKVYDLADIHNMFDSCDVKFDFDNSPFVIVDNERIDLTKEQLSFITPIS